MQAAGFLPAPGFWPLGTICPSFEKLKLPEGVWELVCRKAGNGALFRSIPPRSTPGPYYLQVSVHGTQYKPYQPTGENLQWAVGIVNVCSCLASSRGGSGLGFLSGRTGDIRRECAEGQVASTEDTCPWAFCCSGWPGCL